jgi:hypothetical protein
VFAAHLGAGSTKFEKAAMRWLERCLAEGSPGLLHFAELTAGLAKPEPEAGGQN